MEMTADQIDVELLSITEPEAYAPCDIVEESRTLHIPPNTYENKGLISLGMQAAQELSAIDITQYNLPAVFSHLASSLAGKICCQKIHPSCFFIRIGSTSTGKTQTDKYLRSYLLPRFNTTINRHDGSPPDVINTFYGPTDFASGPGLLRAIQKHSRCLILLDEVTFVFSQGLSGKMDHVTQGKTAALLELSTSAGGRLDRVYGDAGNNIVIDNAIVNMVGNATPLLFKAFTLDDMQSGLIQRFDFFSYDGPAPYRTAMPSVTGEAAAAFAEKLTAIHGAEKPSGRYDIITDSAVDIGMDSAAQSSMMAYSRGIIDDINREPDDGLKGIISRRYDSAFKYALIHAGATRDIKFLFSPLTVEDVIYGQTISDMLAQWKLDVLVKNLSAGEFDTLCQMFIEGAKSAVKNGKKPTGKIIVCRRPKLKNVPPRQFDEIVKVLRARKLIRVTDEPGYSTVYEPLKG